MIKISWSIFISNDLIDKFKQDIIDCDFNSENFNNLINKHINLGKDKYEIIDLINSYLDTINQQRHNEGCTCICFCSECECIGGDGPSTGLYIECWGCDGGCNYQWCSCFG